MKNLVLIAIASLLTSSVSASELRDIKVSEINNVKLELPAVSSPDPAAAPKCGHVSGEITQLHLLAQTAKSLLFTYADTEALFNEFTAMWKPILQKFELTPTTTEYKNEFGKLNYTSADGRVVRDFMAEGLTYNAIDPVEVAKLEHSLIHSLEQLGLPTIASFKIKHDAFRPTFNMYYLTSPAENQDHEIRLRQLKNGEDIDFDVLKQAGVNVIREDSSFSAVYVGKLIGSKSKIAADEAGVLKKLDDYKKFLTEQKKELIGYRVHKITEPFTVGDTTYNYLVNIYFYQ